MLKVHHFLAGPVINPSMLKEELLNSKNKGAVWAGSVYAIIDSIIENDPSIWGIHRFASANTA